MRHKLRGYQQQAVDVIVSTITQKLPGGSVVSLPTGSGKSLVIADATSRLGRHTLIICPTKEILIQDKEELSEYVAKEEIGIYSASLNEKNIRKYTLATIGSIYKKPQLFNLFGLVIVDECDLVPTDEGMFISFFKKLNHPTLIGLTATPYRMVSRKKFYGRVMIIESSVEILPRINPFLWPRIIFNIDPWELVKRGYIAPLKVVNELPLMPFEKIRESSGDFNLKSYAFYANKSNNRIVETVNRAGFYYKSVLVFCCTVEQAVTLSGMVPGSAVVSAKTDKKERDTIIEDFKNGKIKIVFNVGVLTCGFNHPGLDCVVLVRPTKSPRLLYQMAGRATRKIPGKIFGTLIDLTDSTKRIGRIETIQLKKHNETWQLFSNAGRIDGKIMYRYEREI